MATSVDPMWEQVYQVAADAYDHPGDQSPAEAAVSALSRLRLPVPTFHSVLVTLAARGRVVPDELWPRSGGTASQTKAVNNLAADIIDTPDPLWREAFHTAIDAYDHPGDLSPTAAATQALTAMGALPMAIRSVLLTLASNGRPLTEALSG